MPASRDDSISPTIVFLSVHRGASSFIAGALAEAIKERFPGLVHLPIGQLIEERQSIEEISLPPRGALATRLYPANYDHIIEDPPPIEGRFADKKLIMVRRDPRDAAVSWYYSAAYSHPIVASTADWYRRRRDRFLRIGPLEGIRQDTARRAIDEFKATVRWLEQYPQTCQAPYEMLITDCRSWTEKIGEHLDWPDELIDELAHLFAREVDPPAQEDPRRHRRRITPGNWREVFDYDLRAMFADELGEALLGAGYTWE